MSLSILWQILYYGWVASEVVIAIATRTRNSTGNVRDRGTLYLLWAVIFTSMTAGIWLSEATSIGAVPNTHWLGPAALILLIFGLILRWTAILALGKSFSSNVAIHSTQTLLKTGLYRWMRHPSYTGLSSSSSPPRCAPATGFRSSSSLFPPPPRSSTASTSKRSRFANTSAMSTPPIAAGHAA